MTPINPLVGAQSIEQINNWKAAYANGIYSIETNGHIAYFKNPDRHDINCAMSKADKEKALDVYETLAQLTFLGGSEALLVNDQLFLGICKELKAKLEGAKAILVNL